MQTIDRALETQVAIGERILFPWESVNQLVTLSTRELAIMGGAPGSGKSTVAIAMALGATVPTLYCTQDSPASVFHRMAALYSHQPINVVRKTLREGGVMAERLKAIVRDGRREDLIVEHGRQSPGTIDRMIVALEEWLGAPPPLVIIDNLIDMVVTDGNKNMHHQDTGFYAIVLTALKEIANQRGVAIVALHHVLKSGDKGDGTHPITITDLLHGGEREARHVWGVFHDEDTTRMEFQILKQQDGVAKPGGQLRVPLVWVPETGSLIGVSR